MKGWLAPGRLWFEKNLETGQKAADFRIWADKLLSWLGQNWTRTGEGTPFIGPAAEELYARGSIKLGPPQEGMSPEEIKEKLGLT